MLIHVVSNATVLCGLWTSAEWFASHDKLCCTSDLSYVGSLGWNTNVAQEGRHAVRAVYLYASVYMPGDDHGGDEVQDRIAQGTAKNQD